MEETHGMTAREKEMMKRKKKMRKKMKTKKKTKKRKMKHEKLQTERWARD